MYVHVPYSSGYLVTHRIKTALEITPRGKVLSRTYILASGLPLQYTVKPPIKDTPYKDTIQKTSILRTGFLAPNYNFPILLVYFQPLRRGHLPIKDRNCWPQGVLYIKVPLYTYVLLQGSR